jgi:hypothetical protein
MMDRGGIDVGRLLGAITPGLAALNAPVGNVAPARANGALDGERVALLRRGLEEWGVRCREEAGLLALEGFSIVSERGAEIAVAADLAPGARALTYARCLAWLALWQPRRFGTWFRYRAGRAPAHLTLAERRTEAVVEAVARVLLAGRLDAAPRYLLAPPADGSGRDDGAGLLGGCSRAVLAGLHRASRALFWRSDSYQALRASQPMVRLTGHVHSLLSAPEAPRAA